MKHPLAPAFTLALSGLLLSSPAGAQTVQGRLTGTDASSVPPGALILLLDSAGRTAARAVSPASGRFVLTAASGGEYTIRVLRIGFAPAEMRVTLAEGQVLEPVLPLSGARLELPEVRVEGRQMCGTPTPADSLASILWGQAGTALALANESIRSKALHFRTIVDYWSINGLRSDSARMPQLSANIHDAAWPVQSPPPDSLVRHGFILNRDDVDQGPTWYGPDAEFLLSDLFFSTHCFSAVPAAPDVPADWIGLAFHPAREDSRSDIEGTLWLDRRSAALRRVDYGYTRVPGWARGHTAGGQLTFAELPSGGWIVQRWYMLVPVPLVRMPSRSPYFNSYRKSEGFVWVVSDARGREIVRFSP